MKYCKINRMYDVVKTDRIVKLGQWYANSSAIKDNIASIIEDFLSSDANLKDKSILLKPNWVLHNQKSEDEFCLRTHDSVVLALLEIILEQKPARIVIGDAPIQGCNWDKMLSENLIKEVNTLQQRHNIPVAIKDFRRVTFDPALNNPLKDRSSLDDYVIFDLGSESHLEPISTDENIFRVTNYDPDRLAESHKKGIHKYCITKELFDADIVISIPKVKTHQKTGITCALKNLVGLNGDKDFLPHHRIGGTDFGGDCYPGNNLFRLSAEYLLDAANRQQGKWTYKPLIYFSAALWKLSFPKKVHQIAAGWHGNDTTWRMVMDLNKIATFGKADGTISDKPQRNVFSLCDGIIAGQGDGPLNPEPLPLGVLSFTNHSGLNDICMATLMGFDYTKIPLLKNQKIDFKKEDFEIILNDEKVSIQELSKFAVKTTPPPGWINYLA